jgi:hypothetical protein
VGFDATLRITPLAEPTHTTSITTTGGSPGTLRSYTLSSGSRKII